MTSLLLFRVILPLIAHSLFQMLLFGYPKTHTLYQLVSLQSLSLSAFLSASRSFSPSRSQEVLRSFLFLVHSFRFVSGLLDTLERPTLPLQILLLFETLLLLQTQQEILLSL